MGGMVTSTDSDWVEQVEGDELDCVRLPAQGLEDLVCCLCKCAAQCLERNVSSQGVSGNKENSSPSCPVPRRSVQPSNIAT